MNSPLSLQQWLEVRFISANQTLSDGSFRTYFYFLIKFCIVRSDSKRQKRIQSINGARALLNSDNRQMIYLKMTLIVRISLFFTIHYNHSKIDDTWITSCTFFACLLSFTLSSPWRMSSFRRHLINLQKSWILFIFIYNLFIHTFRGWEWLTCKRWY